eukprot:Gb_07456 [translate_table: standard]
MAKGRKGKQGANPCSMLKTEFTDRNPGGTVKQPHEVSRVSNLKGVRSREQSAGPRNSVHSSGLDAINHVIPENSDSSQSCSFSEGGKSCNFSEMPQVAVPSDAAGRDQENTKSCTPVFMEDCSAVGSSSESRFCKGEDNNFRFREYILNQLRKHSLGVEEPELSETQIELNDQEQEDEVLVLKAIYGDDVSIYEREDGGPRAFKISIHVEIPENIAITVRLPQSSDKCESSENYSRSASKNECLVGNIYTFKVQHLPPIELACVLLKSYPCYTAPQFTILAQWLDSVKISRLCDSLDNIWTEEPGQVVIYKWAEWLHTSALSHLGFHDEVELGPSDVPTKVDWRAISGFSSPDVDVPRLMQYNDEKRNEEFHSTLHECPICFNEYLGTEFVKLPCQHIFCCKCMETYALVHVKDGTVNKLNCPDIKCGASIPPGLLKQLLGVEAFERWENLLLQKTLDSMTDVVYCPRCESVCLEEEDHDAQCCKCFFSFCSLCRQRRHVGETCMTPDMRLRILHERQKSCQLGAEQKKREQELINELLSVKQILRDAKQCPSCKMAISKIAGCNKMTCYNCGQYFCYRCNEAIDGYEHFR